MIAFDQEARAGIKPGVGKLTRTVRSTLGPWASRDVSFEFRLKLVFSVAAWFPGGATISQPSSIEAIPLSEPDMECYSIRLPAITIADYTNAEFRLISRLGPASG